MLCYKLRVGKEVKLKLQHQVWNYFARCFAGCHVEVTYLKFKVRSSSHLNLCIFPLINVKPVTCYCNTKLGELIQVEDNVWKSWHQLSLCAEFPKSDAYIGLTQSNFTLPARTAVEGWYLNIVLFHSSK